MNIKSIYWEIWGKRIKHFQLSLESLLILPVQRIPRYELFLKELLKCTGKTHPDYKYLESGLFDVMSILDFCCSLYWLIC